MILDKKMLILGVAALAVIFAFYATIQRSLRPTELDELELQAKTAEYQYKAALLMQKKDMSDHPYVRAVDVVMTIFWKAWPIIGILVATFTLLHAPVKFEFNGIRTWITRRSVPDAVKGALLVSGMSEQTKAEIFKDDVLKGHVEMLAKFAHSVRPNVGRGGMLPMPDTPQAALPATSAVPAAVTLQSAMNTGLIGYGQPIPIGFFPDGTPELRDARSLKTLAVAGLQGSGKTWGVAYLTGALRVNTGADTFIVDPHKQHPEGLHTKLKPFIRRGLITSINPFELGGALQEFDTRIDRRLDGVESCDTPLVIIFDELARLSKSPEIFDALIHLLSRATEETRKTNTIIVGASPKWTARHFNNRADIRDGMNTRCLFRMRKGAAALLCEDRDEQMLLKGVTEPGQFLFLPEESGSKVLTIPFMTESAFEQMAEMGGNARPIQGQVTPQAALQDAPSNFLHDFEQIKARYTLEDIYHKSGLDKKMSLTTFQTKCRPSSHRQFDDSDERAILALYTHD